MTKNTKIVVIGGSGLIGTKLVNDLRRRGHEVIAASPSTGVNTITGEGLANALKGAQVVVDVANAPVWEDKAVLEFFETSGRNLLTAEAAAGVKHHVALSVVGTDRLLASGYFRAKMAQEKLIRPRTFRTQSSAQHSFLSSSPASQNSPTNARAFGSRLFSCSQSCQMMLPLHWPTSHLTNRSTA